MPELYAAILRYGLLLILYLFLFHLARLIARDLRPAAVLSRPKKPLAAPTAPAASAAPTAPTAPAASLVVVAAKNNQLKRGDIYLLGENKTIGRERRNDIVLPERFVSARHAEIAAQDGQWLIRDLGSTNGTYVNGSRVAGWTAIRAGDQIRLGGVTLEVRY